MNGKSFTLLLAAVLTGVVAGAARGYAGQAVDRPADLRDAVAEDGGFDTDTTPFLAGRSGDNVPVPAPVRAGPAAGRSAGLTLADCGRVVGHEMGLLEFSPLSPSPRQVDKVLASPLKFVKISLRRTKDGVWVVGHDPGTMITVENRPVFVNLADVTWDQIREYRDDPGNNVSIFRLSEYLSRDKGRLCWMFSPKVPEDSALISELRKYNAIGRSVILSGDTQWLARAHETDGVNYAGRVNSMPALKALLSQRLPMWAIEIDKEADTPEMIRAVKAAGYKAYADSMDYGWPAELFGTACRKVFDMGVDYTQSNRPLACMREMGWLK